MKPIDAANLLENLGWRYATKKFDASRRISEQTWASLKHAMILSPSSYGLQPWKFIEVNDPAVRQKLRAVSWNQPQITDASHLIVLARKRKLDSLEVGRYIDRIVEVRGVAKDSLTGFRDMMLGTISGLQPEAMEVWTGRQVYIALGFFLSAAAMLGVDACPMEGFDAVKYDEILGLSTLGLAATVVVTAGYRAADDPIAGAAKVRFPESEVVLRV